MGVPQASASTQALARPSLSDTSSHHIGGGEQAGQIVMWYIAEKMHAIRDAEPDGECEKGVFVRPLPRKHKRSAGDCG